MSTSIALMPDYWVAAPPERDIGRAECSPGMGAADGGGARSGGGGGGAVVDLAELTAVCAAVVGCYDRVLTGDRSVPPDLDRALAGARGLRGVPGRLGWAIDLVGRGATGATPAELSLAIETLRRIARRGEQKGRKVPPV
jgi:hypothetical protein